MDQRSWSSLWQFYQETTHVLAVSVDVCLHYVFVVSVCFIFYVYHAKTSTFGPCFDLCLITTHTNITSDPDAYDLFYPPSMLTIILLIGIGIQGNQIQPMSSNSQIVSTLLQWIIPLWLWEQLIVTSSSSTCRVLRSLCFRTAYARVHLFSCFGDGEAHVFTVFDLCFWTDWLILIFDMLDGVQAYSITSKIPDTVCCCIPWSTRILGNAIFSCVLY
jgi:hypothetical protein